MKLSDYQLPGARLVRDGLFHTLGMSRHAAAYMLTFVEAYEFLAEVRENRDISCIICSVELLDEINRPDCGILLSREPRLDFFRLNNILAGDPRYGREKFLTRIDPSSRVSKLACVAEHNVVIGKNCVIEEFVSIRENTSIGDNVRIGAGTVLGGDGFHHIRVGGEEAALHPVHCGGVIIHSGVKIDCNCAVDRALFPWDDSILGPGTRLDNLTHIAHGVKTGKRCFFAAGAITGGYMNIGDDVWFGLNCCLAERLNVGDKARISMGAVVTRDVPAGETVSGNFALRHERFLEHLRKIR